MPARTPFARAAVGAALLAVVLTGCSDPRPPVVGGSGTPGAGQSTTDPSDPGPTVGQPLTAADMPGWVDTALPAGAEESLVTPCGTPTGAREHQAVVRAAAMTTPTGIAVVSQVADYTQAPSTVVTDVIAPALVACPSFTDGADTVRVRSLPPSTQAVAAGAEIVRTHADGTRTVTVYWVAVNGGSTVEVAVTGQMGALGTSPLEPFAGEVLAAAAAKAAGSRVPSVTSPTLPDMATTDRVGATGQPGTGDQQSSDPGLATGPGDPTGEGEVPNTPLPGGTPAQGPAPVGVDPSIPGESGPGIVSSTSGGAGG